jgi:hypothetical protein
MFRFCLLLGLAAPVWATPITGNFDISADSNFADILGDGFAWQFHQGNAGSIFTVCPGNTCSLDGSAAPASFALLNSNNWFRASNGSEESSGNLKPGFTTGGIGGSFTWHVSKTDWSDVPAGSAVAVSLPMDVSGLLIATDNSGHAFIQTKLTGTGNFETTVMRTGDSVTFFGAAGRFDGTVTSQDDPPDPVQTGGGNFGSGAATGAVSGSVIGSSQGQNSGEVPGQNSGQAASGTAAQSGGQAASAGCASAGETAVPEPATYLLAGLGLAYVAALRRRFV